MKDKELSCELQERVREVKKDHACPSCPEHEPTAPDIETSVEELNPDAELRDRG